MQQIRLKVCFWWVLVVFFSRCWPMIYRIAFKKMEGERFFVYSMAWCFLKEKKGTWRLHPGCLPVMFDGEMVAILWPRFRNNKSPLAEALQHQLESQNQTTSPLLNLRFLLIFQVQYLTPNAAPPQKKLRNVQWFCCVANPPKKEHPTNPT